MKWMNMSDDQIKALDERARRDQLAYERLAKKYPGLNPITLIVMASDYSNLPEVAQMFASGEWDFKKSCFMLGSYARFEWAVEQLNAGRVDPQMFYKMLPELWSSSDPDDTDPSFLAVWRKAATLRGGKYLRDGRPLPRQEVLTIYRGQANEDDEPGFAWSLDFDVACQFARGASLRVPTPGVILRGYVSRKHVYGYMTGRHEDEVIVSPAVVHGIEIVGRYVRNEADGKEE